MSAPATPAPTPLREDPPAGPARPHPPRDPIGRGRAFLARHDPQRLVLAAIVLVVAGGAVLRFVTTSHIWLDEALTIEISGRPLPKLLDALRHDGSPPLYYLLLHYWMELFGRGDVAVRALSGVLSLGTLPLAWFAGRRVGQIAIRFGRWPGGGNTVVDRTGVAALLFFATSPYMIRYGNETRMYSLVVFLSLAFGLVLARAWEKPCLHRWAAVTVVTAALAYTHYWTFLEIGTVAFFCLLQAHRRRHYRPPALKALLAMSAAVIPFAPWVPTFLFQMTHTGTPWAPQVHAEVILDTVFSWAGPASAGALLAMMLMLLAFIGYAARPIGDGLHLRLSGRVPGRYLVAMWVVPLVLAYFAFTFSGSAFAERYTGISLPPFLLVAALGVGLLPSGVTVSCLLAATCGLGLVGGYSLNSNERTNASDVATRIAQQARPGDVVGYCPDQLAPAVHRMLVDKRVSGLKERSFADASGPALVDWVDYQQRMSGASATEFAHELDDLAGPNGSIYLVMADGLPHPR